MDRIYKTNQQSSKPEKTSFKPEREALHSDGTTDRWDSDHPLLDLAASEDKYFKNNSMRPCTFQEEIEVSASTQRATPTAFVLLHQNSYIHHLFFSSSAAWCPNHEPCYPAIDDFIPHMTGSLFVAARFFWLYNSIIRHNNYFHRQSYHDASLESTAATKQSEATRGTKWKRINGQTVIKSKKWCRAEKQLILKC